MHVADLMAELLQAHGLRVSRDAALEGRSGGFYKVPVLAEKEDGAWTLHVLDADTPVTPDMVEEVSRGAADVGATGAVIVHLHPATTGARAGNVALWGPDEAARLVGGAHLAQCMQVAPASLPLPVPAPVAQRDAVAAAGDAPSAATAPETPAAASPAAAPPSASTPPAAGLPTAHGPASATASDPNPAPDLGALIDYGTLEPEEERPDATPFAPFSIGLAEDEGMADDPSRAAPEAETESATVPEREAEAEGGAALPDLAAFFGDGPEETLDSTPPQAHASPPPAPSPTTPSPAGPPPAPPMDSLVAAAQAHTPPPEAEATATPDLEHPVLCLHVPLDKAKAIARDRVFTVDHIELVLHPVHLVRYECDLLAEGSLRYDTVSGIVQVHATDKTAGEVGEGIEPEGVAPLPEPWRAYVRDRRVRIAAERARELAFEWVMAAHTRVVDVRVDDEEQNFSITEKHRVSPRPDHARLEHAGVFYRGVWRLSGTNGSLEIDAITGSVDDEGLRNPSPGIVMLD